MYYAFLLGYFIDLICDVSVNDWLTGTLFVLCTLAVISVTCTYIFKLIPLILCFIISQQYKTIYVYDQYLFPLFGFCLLSGFLRSTSFTFTLKVYTGNHDLHTNTEVYSQVFTSPVVKVPRYAVRDTSSAPSRYVIGIDKYIYMYSPTFTAALWSSVAQGSSLCSRLDRLSCSAAEPAAPCLLSEASTTQRPAQLPKSSR